MKTSQILITLALLCALLAVNRYAAGSDDATPGGVPFYGWAGVGCALFVAGILFVVRDNVRARRAIEEQVAPPSEEYEGPDRLTREQLDNYDPDGPDYPHPVIITERCIGCHACVDACPHDVLAIVNNYATPIARDQCMEDTSCQVECPVNPKACIVVNTTKKILPRKVPNRDVSFMTDVPGCYIIGDVSGTPLIKNAANEGADVVRHIAHELAQRPVESKAQIEVAIIGIGPAGLSAAVTAQRLGLSYVGIEQDRVLATITAYPANKYIFFKPETMEARGGVEVEGAGAQREVILESWMRTMLESGVRINEFESCNSVAKAEDGDYFVVKTERGANKESVVYRARRVVLALGNRGTPMKLNVPGEDLKITRDRATEDKVKYKLSNAEDYKRRNIVVVGAGNSAIEAAVDLVARRHGDRISFRPESEINRVTLVIRSEMKNDLKFTNKTQVYDCIDEGRIEVFFGASIKEIRDSEVVLMNARTGEVTKTIPNDFVFAMIGGNRPVKFLESIGIKIN